MLDQRLDPVRDIDWDDDFVWVQRAPVLTVLDRGAGWIHVRHPAGGEITLTRAVAEAEYFPIKGGAMLKPRYAPIKAHCAATAASMGLACGTVRLEAGDVLLNQGGRYSVVRAAIFERDYIAVAYGHDGPSESCAHPATTAKRAEPQHLPAAQRT